jgi:hypothetical protein
MIGLQSGETINDKTSVRLSSGRGEAVFQPGMRYQRKAIHDLYGGGRQVGISKPAQGDFIMIFSGRAGLRHGYEDRWLDDRLYLYCGEGQFGDQEMTRGNLSILNHRADENSLHLFKGTSGDVEYVGEMEYLSHEVVDGVEDRDGNLRKVIVFTLRRVRCSRRC